MSAVAVAPPAPAAPTAETPRTVYAVERWRDLKTAMLPLLIEHWHEIALDKAKVPLDIDHERYDELDATGHLHIVTAREGGELIGYHVAIVAGHLHYRSTLHGITDVYYVAPAKRKGFTGIRLFQAVERELRVLGVRKLYTGTKLHLDMSPLFERLGYRRTEYLYTKLLEG